MITIVHQHFVPKLNPEYGGSLVVFYELPPDHQSAFAFNCQWCGVLLTSVNQGVIPLAALTDRKHRESIDNTTCVCRHCASCLAALEVLKTEHFLLAFPDKFNDVPNARHYAEIGAIPGKEWCEQCSAIKDQFHHVES